MSAVTAFSVSPELAEHVYRRARELQFAKLRNEVPQHRFDNAMRAAKARNSRLLAMLDGCANITERMREHQMGETQRMSGEIAIRVPPTEVTMFKEAYKLLDAGTPAPQLLYIYAAAAETCGLI